MHMYKVMKTTTATKWERMWKAYCEALRAGQEKAEALRKLHRGERRLGLPATKLW